MGDPAAGDGPGGEGSRTSAAVYRRLVEGITSHAVFMLDPSGAIANWPEPARALYGFDASAVIDRPLGVLFADGGHASEDLPVGTTGGSVETEGWHERADGSVFWATCTLSPLRDERLRGYGVVCRDTTETKQYEQMLERQNDRLKEFTDILAHDLRNPLAVIDQRLELYRETGDDDHLASIDRTTARMERLVDDLLRVARQGGVVSNPEPIDVERVIGLAWEGTGEPADGATLHYEEVGFVNGDADRLRELFENLFRNAVVHAGEEATVRVGPLANGFYVEDDGPGVPPDSRGEVFDHGVTTAENGSGYGLSIVRTIANAHGWDVVATEAATGGARFEFTGIEFAGHSTGR